MASQPWAGEKWIGGVLVAGGLAIAAISFADDAPGTMRTALIGALILSAGIGTIVHARREVQITRCAQCTIVLAPDSQWMRCSVCASVLHVNCSDMHAEVYHPLGAPGEGPYRTPK